jgi:hypothetical protein
MVKVVIPKSTRKEKRKYLEKKGDVEDQRQRKREASLNHLETGNAKGKRKEEADISKSLGGRRRDSKDEGEIPKPP